MKKFLISIFLTLFVLHTLIGQDELPYGNSTDLSLPEWARMMYEPQPNIGEVVAAYESYYQTHAFVKNNHTQFYKRWLRNVGTYEFQFIDPNASPEEIANRKASNQAYAKKMTQVGRNTAANWKAEGPFDWDHEAADRSYAPGAAHVYTVEHCKAVPTVLYAGTATAGIWKSVDNGESWSNVSKGLIVNQVYAIEVHHTNPDIVYARLFNNIYKTIDGGINWLPTGSAEFQNLSFQTKDIRMHPSNGNVLLVATDVGLFRTINGGTTWTQVLSGSFQEIEYHPTNPNKVYVIKQVDKRTEFYKSTNGGQTFAIQTNGWPAPGGSDENKRAEIAVTLANPNKVYALLTGKENGGSGLYGVYVSENEGASWTFNCCGSQPGGQPDLSAIPPNINTMGWQDNGSDDGGQYYYDLAFAVSPTDEDLVFLGGVNMWVSRDGGNTFSCPAKWNHPDKPNYIHADIHDIHFYENGEIWVACDGGIFYSTDDGASFERRMYGIAGTDFWGFGVSFWGGEAMVGGAYHNGTLLKHGDVYINGWLSTDGGDGTGGFFNIGNDDEVYSDYNIKTLVNDRLQNMPTRTYLQKPFTHQTIGRSSQIAFDPRCFQRQYFGRDDGLWLTEDDHFSTTLVYDFNESVADVELGWTNSDTIYVSTWPGPWNHKKVYRSYDAGNSWTEITPSNSVFNNGRHIGYDIVVSEKDANIIWLARVGTQTNDNNKIFKSTNGGNSWTNITTSALEGEVLTNITLHRGTNNGIYIGTSRAVYYKSDDMDDWELFNNDLPASTFSRRLYINYRTGTIINGTNRSVWRSNLYESAAPVAQISVNKLRSGCSRDTFYFSDYSSVNELNAGWNWSFPGAIYVSSTTSRNPKVVYGNAGTYDVSLTVSDANGSDSQTLSSLIQVDNYCDPDIVAGKNLYCLNPGDYVQTPSLKVETNTITISAWIKPEGNQNAYTGIVFNDGTSAGLNFTNNNQLAYHWTGGSTHWGWESGLFVPVNEWSYVAMVVSPTQITFYLNEQEASRSVNLEPVLFEELKIGSFKGWVSRNFRGNIEEVSIWNRSLSRDEIRKLRHLTKDQILDIENPEYDSDLLAYYQFNDQGPKIYDRAGVSHSSLQGGAVLAVSSAPVGGGKSVLKNISTGGAVNFDESDVTIGFPLSGSFPNGEIVVSKLYTAPDVHPTEQMDVDPYWIINNYGNTTFSALESILFKGVSGQLISPEDEASVLTLYRRPTNADGPNWGEFIDVAAQFSDSEDGSLSVSFVPEEGINSFSQFAVSRDPALPIVLIGLRALPQGGDVLVKWETEFEKDSKRFELERSPNGVDWQNCSSIDANGQEVAYEYLDPSAFSFTGRPTLFYRLKIIDQEGNYTYSNIQTVNYKWAEDIFSISPNPVDDLLRVDLKSIFSGSVQIDVLSVRGRLLWSGMMEVEKGNNAYQLAMGAFPSGMYLLRMRMNDQVLTKRIVVD
jgi:PKD repeat protein